MRVSLKDDPKVPTQYHFDLDKALNPIKLTKQMNLWNKSIGFSINFKLFKFILYLSGKSFKSSLLVGSLG